MEKPLPELRDLIDRLDALISKEGAKLRIPADPDGRTSVGTRQGYLRLGIELLRAGSNPSEPSEEGGRPFLAVDIENLLTPDSESPFELCELVDDPEGLPPRVRKLGPLGQLLAALIAVVVVGLIILGAVAVVSRIVR
jgi:hypothetical protein